MATKIITDVVEADEPIAIADARLHCKLDLIGVSHPDDDLIKAIVTAVREKSEHYAGRSFAVKTLEDALDEFPAGGEFIALTVGPVASITSIKYDDEDGVEQTLAIDQYSLDLYDDATRVHLAPDATWPATKIKKNAVRVRYVTADDCPKVARQAMLLSLRHLYDNRADSISGTIISPLPNGAESLLDAPKIWGI